MDYDAMLWRGGGRLHGPPPRNPFGRGAPPGWEEAPGYDYGWRPAADPRRMRYGRWDPPGGGGYDRGAHGEAYEGPAGPWRTAWRGRVPGEFGDAPFGGPGPGRGPWPDDPRGYDRGGWGGDGGYAREPFMPEEAYRRHPEYRQPPERGRGWGREAPGWEPGDREILQAVRERLYHDVWLDIDRLDVEVEDGVVTLTGEVDDFLEARYAWDDAWETPGVRGVVNHLTVRTDLPAEDHGDVVPQSSGEPSPARAEAAGVEEQGGGEPG